MSISRSASTTAAKTIHFDERTMYVELRNGTHVTAALNRFPRLLNGSPEQRAVWRVIGAGDGINWPLLDEDISIAGLMRDKAPSGKEHKSMDEVMSLLGEIYANSLRLSALTGGRRFTLDGVFVSTTGRVVAEYIYGLLADTQPGNYARTSDGRQVQIMLAGETGTGFSVSWKGVTDSAHPELMLCLKFGQKGFEEIYNGPFPHDLLASRAKKPNRQTYLPAAILQEENLAVLPKKHSFASINVLFQSKLDHAA